MVVSRISMGLGNQMFQYAAGRSLSLTIAQTFKVDISSYSRYGLRKYEIAEFFEVEPPIATEEELSGFKFSHPVRRAWNKVFRKNRITSLPYEEKWPARLLYNFFYIFQPPHRRPVFEERQFHFDKNFFNTRNIVCLKGYWMSYKYFKDYEDIIKKDFTIRKEKLERVQYLADEINNCNSVAVHVRCGDKMEAKYLKLYGELSASYYKSGIEYITEKKGNLHLYVFSDDIEMAKNYLPVNVPCTYVSKYISKSAIEDFYLITQCKNVIMANSTFSWWAAYLNSHSDKIVVTPERWYNISSYDYKDIYYPSWVKLKN